MGKDLHCVRQSGKGVTVILPMFEMMRFVG